MSSRNSPVLTEVVENNITCGRALLAAVAPAAAVPPSAAGEPPPPPPAAGGPAGDEDAGERVKGVILEEDELGDLLLTCQDSNGQGTPRRMGNDIVDNFVQKRSRML